MEKWNDKMKEQVRRFVEAQLDVFESSSSGYFMWSAKGPGGRGFLNGIKAGTIPNSVTERKYPGQCMITHLGYCCSFASVSVSNMWSLAGRATGGELPTPYGADVTELS